jgi:cell division protease FtsH
MSRKKLLAEMVSLLGGRAAEEVVFDDITSGASNDLERVTRMARTMVTRLGMSEELGPMVYGQKEELIFLGREISEQRDYSESVAEKIDLEVRQLVSAAYDKAKEIVIQYREYLDKVANRLLEVETISRDEFESLFPPPHVKKSYTPTPRSEKQTSTPEARRKRKATEKPTVPQAPDAPPAAAPA